MKYTIKGVWRCRVRRWLVILQGKFGPVEVARFGLKREAIAYVIAQEKKS